MKFRPKTTRILLEHLFYHKILSRIGVDSTPRKGSETVEKTRQARWDAAHVSTASTRMMRREYLELRAACEVAGTTVYALILSLLRDWMMDFRAEYPNWDAALKIRKE